VRPIRRLSRRMHGSQVLHRPPPGRPRSRMRARPRRTVARAPRGIPTQALRRSLSTAAANRIRCGERTGSGGAAPPAP
jgi:hypothetical protein